MLNGIGAVIFNPLGDDCYQTVDAERDKVTPVGFRDTIAGNERALVTHQEFRRIGNLVRRTGSACGASCKHILIEIASGTVELIQRQRCNNDAGCNGIEPSAALAPFYCLCHHELFVASLRHLVGMEGIADIFRLPETPAASAPRIFAMHLAR